jgi:pentapeptide repeat protein
MSTTTSTNQSISNLQKQLKDARASLCKTKRLADAYLQIERELEELKQRKRTLQGKAAHLKEKLEAQLKTIEVKETDVETPEAELKEAELKEAELKEAELKEAELKEAELKETKLKEAELKEAELKETELETVLGSTTELKFSDGACLVHPSVLDQRFPSWNNKDHPFQKISAVQGIVIVDYLHTDKCPFSSMCVSDVLNLLTALHFVKVDRLEKLCNFQLKLHLNVTEYTFALMYAIEHKLTKTEVVIRNLIHRDMKKFIQCKEVRELGGALIAELVLDSFEKYEELKTKVHYSTYRMNMQEVIRANNLSVGLKEFITLTKAYSPQCI